jgi:hypothetical protein
MSNCCSWGKLLLFNYLINIYYTKKTDKIVDEILALPVVISVWENITDLDCDISNECKKLVLENFVKLFVRVQRHCESLQVKGKNFQEGIEN